MTPDELRTAQIKLCEDITLYAKWTRVESPQTYDSIVLYVSLGFISVAGLAGAAYYLKKHNM